MPNKVGNKTGPAADDRSELPAWPDALASLPQAHEVVTRTRQLTADGDAMPEDELIDKVAAAIRECYMQEYRRAYGDVTYGVEPIKCWDGGRDASGRHATSVWLDIARYALAEGLDPFLLVQARFAAINDGTPRPIPRQLLGARGKSCYQHFYQDAIGRLQRRLDSQVAAVNNQMSILRLTPRFSPADRFGMALTDRSLQLSPLFVYCVVWWSFKQLPEVQYLLKIFHAQALEQYLFQQQLYDAAWGDMIPHELQYAATELRARLLA